MVVTGTRRTSPGGASRRGRVPGRCMLAWIVVLLGLVSGCAHAPTGGRMPPITGQVTTTKGEPLPRVTVTILRADQTDDRDAPACDVLTNADGRFVCEVLRDSNLQPVPFERRRVYEIQCSLTGFKEARRRFEYRKDVEPFKVVLADVLADAPSRIHSETPTMPQGTRSVEDPLPGN